MTKRSTKQFGFSVKVPGEVKRVPVDFRYDAINLDFLKGLARIGGYAAEKYGSWEQYSNARLTGEKSPLNHAYEHLRQYAVGEPYDHFDGDVKWHLVAAAYNLMMEFFYATKWGPARHPLVVERKCEAPEATNHEGDHL